MLNRDAARYLYLRDEQSGGSWNVGFGLMMLSHLQLGASYSIPLSKSGTVNDIYKGVVDNIEIKNKEWQIRLNYFF